MEIIIVPDSDRHGLMWIDVETDTEGDFGITPFNRELILEHLDLLLKVARSHLIRPCFYLIDSDVEIIIDDPDRADARYKYFIIKGSRDKLLTLMEFLGATGLDRI